MYLLFGVSKQKEASTAQKLPRGQKGKSKIILETTENSVKARNIIFDKPTIEAAALTKA